MGTKKGAFMAKGRHRPSGDSCPKPPPLPLDPPLIETVRNFASSDMVAFY